MGWLSVLGQGIGALTGMDWLGSVGQVGDAAIGLNAAHNATQVQTDLINLQKNMAEKGFQIATDQLNADNAVRDRVLQRTDNLGKVLSDVFTAMGPPTVLTNDMINARANELYGQNVADITRAENLASSQGYADQMRRGTGTTDRSTPFADQQSDLVRKFAPLFMQARNSAVTNAIGEMGARDQSVNTSRNNAIGQYAGVLSAPINAELYAMKGGAGGGAGFLNPAAYSAANAVKEVNPTAITKIGTKDLDQLAAIFKN